MTSIFDKLLRSKTASVAPKTADVYQRALMAVAENDLQSAAALLDQVVASNPRHAEALYKRGNVLKDLGHLEAAVDSYDRAIAEQTDYSHAYCNRGVLLHRLGRLDEALLSYEQAVSLDPRDALTHYNRALLLQDLSRWEDAIASYDSAIELNPSHSEAQYNRSLALLFLGRYEEGWRGYEWRWKHAHRLAIGTVRNLDRPLWLGEQSLSGKRILLHAEGGLGDTIQFCRYAPLCASLGATVYLEVQPALASLLSDLSGVSAVVPIGAQLPDFDYHAPLMSLPLAFRTTPATVPLADGYLAPEPALVRAWRQRLGPRLAPRIGLTWSGNANNWIDAKRSISLSEWGPSLPAGFEYFCLQRGIRPADQDYLRSGVSIKTFDETLLDFPNTAALSSCMDLCICVDTSVAHLSGALGLKTWLLIPHHSDWRWLRDQPNTPWYAKMQIFRQDTPFEWQHVFARVSKALQIAYEPQD